jgi:hypothetical protein
MNKFNEKLYARTIVIIEKSINMNLLEGLEDFIKQSYCDGAISETQKEIYLKELNNKCH